MHKSNPVHLSFTLKSFDNSDTNNVVNMYCVLSMSWQSRYVFDVHHLVFKSTQPCTLSVFRCGTRQAETFITWLHVPDHHMEDRRGAPRQYHLGNTVNQSYLSLLECLHSSISISQSRSWLPVNQANRIHFLFCFSLSQ